MGCMPFYRREGGFFGRKLVLHEEGKLVREACKKIVNRMGEEREGGGNYELLRF